MRSLAEELGINVRNKRSELCLTQEELASLTDLDVKTISSIENGRSNPRLLTIQILAEHLEVEPYQLLIVE